MSTVISPEQFAVYCGTFGQRLETNLMRAEQESIEEAEQEARQLSSGPFSSEQLRKMRHPYARRAPHPPGDNPGIINKQSGEFLEGWEIEEPRTTGDGTIVSRVFNNSPNADRLANGTKRMIRRPLPRRLRERIAATRNRRIQDAIRKTIQQF